MNKAGKSYRWSKTVKGSIDYSTVISAQSDAERTCWCCFTQQWPITLWRSTFRWEFSIWIGRAVAIPAGTQIKCLLQVFALLQLTLSHKAQVYRGTAVHLSALKQHGDSIPSFRSVGWKYLVSINYYIPRLKKYSIAQSAVSVSGSWRQGTRLNELHLSSETKEA